MPEIKYKKSSEDLDSMYQEGDVLDSVDVMQQEINLQLFTDGLYFADEMINDDNGEWNIAMVGFRIGEPANENGYVFTRPAAETWISSFNDSIPGRDGHTSGSSYKSTAVVWNSAKISENDLVIFYGKGLTEDYDTGKKDEDGLIIYAKRLCSAAAKLKSIYESGITLFSSVVVTVPRRKKGDVTYDQETWSVYLHRFVITALDFVVTPAEPMARIQNEKEEYNNGYGSLKLYADLQGVDRDMLEAEFAFNQIDSNSVEKTERSESEETKMTKEVNVKEDSQNEIKLLKQQAEDSKILNSVWTFVSDLPSHLQMEAGLAIQSEFIKRREQYPEEPAKLLLEASVEPGKAEARKKAEAEKESDVVENSQETEKEETVEESVPAVVDNSDVADSKENGISELRREVSDNKAMTSAWQRLTELPEQYRISAYNSVNSEFAERRSVHPNASSSLILDAAYDNAVKPFRDKAAREMVEKEFGSAPDGTPTAKGKVIESDDDPGIKMDDVSKIEAVKSQFEKDFGRPDYHRPVVDIMNTLFQDKKYIERYKEFSGGSLPQDVSMSNSNVGNNWLAARKIGEAFEDARQGIDGDVGATNKELMIEEYKTYRDSGKETGSAMQKVMESWSPDQIAIYNLSTTDIAIPRTVSRSFIDIIYPRISMLEMFNVQTMMSTKDQFFVENRTPVESSADSITLSGTLAAGAEFDLGVRHIDSTKTIAMAGVTRASYAIDYAKGIIKNVTASNITFGKLTCSRYKFDFAEESSPPETKVKTEPEDVDMGWDGLKVRLTHRAEVEGMANSGYPVVTRAIMAATYDLGDMIDRDLGQHAEYACRQYIPSGQSVAFTGSSTNSTHYKTAYEYIGRMCAKREDAGHYADMVYMNNVVHDQFSNLDLFDRDGTPAAMLSPMNKIGRLKGKPIGVSRRWDNDFLAMGTNPLGWYAVLASNPFTISAPTDAKDANGNAIAVREWIFQICHWIGGPYKFENFALLTSDVSKTSL